MRTRKFFPFLLSVVLLTVWTSCTRSPQPAPVPVSKAEVAAGPLYTSYNLWYEKPTDLYSVNYQVGGIIPAGTAVTSVRAGLSRRRLQTVTFTTGDGGTYTIHFDPKYHGPLNFGRFVDRLFMSKDFAALTLGFSRAEMESVRQARAEPGIRKEAVVVTYGYPPEHQTQSLSRNIWFYWQNRFVKRAVYFEKDRFIRED
ncbi:hypothetical protein HQ520_05460 [bacterium]|nr:hypothetical protein [bacterium]